MCSIQYREVLGEDSLKMMIGLRRMTVSVAMMMMMRMMMTTMMMMTMMMVKMMIGLRRMTVPVAIWCRAEGSKKTRLSDPTVNHLQLHHSIPNPTLHFTDTYTGAHSKVNCPGRAELGRWDCQEWRLAALSLLRMTLFIC